MSAALVRQALEFVDPDVSGGKCKKRVKAGAARRESSSGQVSKGQSSPKQHILKKNNKKEEQESRRVIKQLLQLSKPAVDQDIATKIVRRAAAGKAVVDKIEVKKAEPEQSILFPEDNIKIKKPKKKSRKLI